MTKPVNSSHRAVMSILMNKVETLTNEIDDLNKQIAIKTRERSQAQASIDAMKVQHPGEQWQPIKKDEMKLVEKMVKLVRDELDDGYAGGTQAGMSYHRQFDAIVETLHTMGRFDLVEAAKVVASQQMSANDFRLVTETSHGLLNLDALRRRLERT